MLCTEKSCPTGFPVTKMAVLSMSTLHQKFSQVSALAYLQYKVTCREYFYRAPVGVHNVLRILQHQQLVRRPLVQRQNVGLSALKLLLFIAVVRSLVRVNQPADGMYRRLSRPVRRGRVLRQGRAARPHRRSCRGACLTQTPAASLGWRHLSALGPAAPRAGPRATSFGLQA
jgi:hypothetical protein